MYARIYDLSKKKNLFFILEVPNILAQVYFTLAIVVFFLEYAVTMWILQTMGEKIEIKF